jgi:predicted nuclease with TOPRIM domain
MSNEHEPRKPAPGPEIQDEGPTYTRTSLESRLWALAERVHLLEQKKNPTQEPLERFIERTKKLEDRLDALEATVDALSPGGN